jgi:hypothetical protein
MSRFFSINAEAPPFLGAAELDERKPVTDLWNRLSVVAKQQWNEVEGRPKQKRPGFSIFPATGFASLWTSRYWKV